MEASESVEHPDGSLTVEELLSSSEQQLLVTNERLAQEIGQNEITERCYAAETAIENVSAEPAVTIGIDEGAIEKLSNGLLKNCLNDQRMVKKLLHDVTESQRVILETLQQENAKFTECQILQEVSDVMEKAKQYHTKLLNIKKEMLALHEKSAILKRRAVKIQQEKQQEAFVREQQRERELEKKKKLTAKMAKPASKPT